MSEIERRDGTITPFNAGDAVAAVVDILSVHGVRVPPTLRARLGKAAKACLEDEFKPEEVVAALTLAARRARVDLVEQILLDMQLAASGQLVAPSDYWRALEDHMDLARERMSHDGPAGAGTVAQDRGGLVAADDHRTTRLLAESPDPGGL